MNQQAQLAINDNKKKNTEKISYACNFMLSGESNEKSIEKI
jgi:hypothetical protein